MTDTKKQKSGKPAAREMNSPGNRAEQEKKNNDKKNVPVLVITYMVLLLFIGMFAYIIKFVVKDADTAIANSYNKRQSVYAQKVIKGEIISSDGEVLAETKVDADGNETRYYPYSNMFAHAIGYDSNGQAGLEMMSAYYLLTSNQNIITKTYNTISEEKSLGNNVITTLSYKLQSTAYNALGSNNGAVVVIEPSTGKILTMVSKPDYNPNDIANVIAETSSDSSSSCLLNRATQGLYPPGSTFKVLTALEYIRENPRTYGSYSYNCESEGVFNSVSIHCYNYKYHGLVDLKDSLAYSCNTSFSNIGTTLDIDSLHELCNSFLFNSELPFDGLYKESQFVLDSSMDKSYIPQTAIGQGDTLITPLHNALIMCTIANGGVLMKPYLIDRIENCDGALVRKFSTDSYGKIISADEAATMTELLTGVTEYGTAADKFKGASYTVAGKTGTAEYNSNGDSHSWFVGFSNVDNPDIVVCVLIENASSTGSSAAAVARKVFDAYYSN
jgi:peptidoglycan glycosyltransferase